MQVQLTNTTALVYKEKTDVETGGEIHVKRVFTLR